MCLAPVLIMFCGDSSDSCKVPHVAVYLSISCHSLQPSDVVVG